MKRADLLILLAFAAIFALAPALWTVWTYERTLSQGKIVLLALAPVDPRSLMQGDYMALRFAIDRTLQDARYDGDARYAYIALDPAGRASLRQTGNDLPPPEGSFALRIRRRQGEPTLGPNAFFFQEGQGDDFAAARFGEFRVTPDGKALLTYLRDADLERLGENLR
ncbi:MAG: GDYXXLXY domain-containing protein [Zoogloeaceae bacterium]|nr:GDYXXLXY domain-containing protein [Zoogloeaceae bacterium]